MMGSVTIELDWITTYNVVFFDGVVFFVDKLIFLA